MKTSIKFKTTVPRLLILFTLGCFALLPIAQAAPSPTNVNVVNTPNVNVVNTTASPVPVRDVDNPARQPFQAEAMGGFADGASTTGDITIGAVPAGKRLVIEYVSVFGTMLPGQKMIRASIQTEDVSIYLRISPQGSNAGGSRDYFIASEHWSITGKVRPSFRGTGERDSFAGANPDSVTFTISGYLVDCPECVP